MVIILGHEKDEAVAVGAEEGFVPAVEKALGFGFGEAGVGEHLQQGRGGGVAFGRLTWAGALEAIRQTIKTSALIFTILIGATIFGYYMAMSKIPQQVVAAVTEMNLNRWVVIVGIVVAYFVISMFMDELPLLLLTLQLTFPLITSLGFDPIWFGVMSMLMLSMGLVFPPVGMIAFVVASSANVSLVKVYTGTSILMIALVLTTVLLMVFPQIALWLPATMK